MSEIERLNSLMAAQEQRKRTATATIAELQRKHEERRPHTELATVRTGDGQRYSYSPELATIEDKISAAQREMDDADRELRFLETRLSQAQQDALMLKKAIGGIILEEVLPFLGDLPAHVESRVAPLRQRLAAIIGE